MYPPHPRLPAAGDQVLQGLAKIFTSNFRRLDIIGRYGGEEFIVIMPDTDLNSSWLAAERLRKGAETHDFSRAGVRENVTISIGLAQMKEGENSGDLISRADRALYQSKEGGRNRVTAAD